MEKQNFLKGKRILLVDDESDVLEALQDLLTMCEIDMATTYEQAWEMLGTRYYDLAILDIMGVNGYRLLELANDRGISAVMLTAHALTPEDIEKSYHGGAALYLPKDEMANITKFLEDVLEAKETGKNTWWRWFERLGLFFIRRFGPEWTTQRKDFLEKYIYF